MVAGLGSASQSPDMEWNGNNYIAVGWSVAYFFAIGGLVPPEVPAQQPILSHLINSSSYRVQNYTESSARHDQEDVTCQQPQSGAEKARRKETKKERENRRQIPREIRHFVCFSRGVAIWLQGQEVMLIVELAGIQSELRGGDGSRKRGGRNTSLMWQQFSRENYNHTFNAFDVKGLLSISCLRLNNTLAKADCPLGIPSSTSPHSFFLLPSTFPEFIHALLGHLQFLAPFPDDRSTSSAVAFMRAPTNRSLLSPPPCNQASMVLTSGDAIELLRSVARAPYLRGAVQGDNREGQDLRDFRVCCRSIEQLSLE